ETLITHFLQVSWGPVMPANESFQMIEATKGINSYYLTSDGSTMSYHTRIRTPSFPHLQQIPAVIRGSMVSDLIAYLGSIDFVMADVDSGYDHFDSDRPFCPQRHRALGHRA